MDSTPPLLEKLCGIARAAGAETLRFYGHVEATAKADNSPLTAADLASHQLIVSQLQQLHPSLPVLSEESSEAEAQHRLQWKQFWLVDPLDGTKEFLKKTGEFTVNIALIEKGVPTLGVVYAPVLNLMYWAFSGSNSSLGLPPAGGAWRQRAHQKPESIRVRKPSPLHPTLVASRDHAGPAVQALFQRFPQATTSSMGSSLKFCLVAEGSADVYLRDLPTMEWDTAAAQCIVQCAGGTVQSLESLQPLAYNKASLRNPGFVALGDPDFPWKG